MSGDAAQQPRIEPDEFDVIVLGTGLQEAILAGCASALWNSKLQMFVLTFC